MTNTTEEIFNLTPDEVVLSDDCPIYPDYLYICDGVFVRSNHFGTVLSFKIQLEYKEIRRCNIFAHEGAKIGDKVQ